MKSNILWSGVEYDSLENCRIQEVPDGFRVNSVIVGLYKGTIYRVNYELCLDKAWRTRSCIINACINDREKHIEVKQEGDQWLLNGEICADFEGCTDVDIPLTPLTNSLPINRLKMPVGQEAKVKIIYIDLLEDTLRPVHQLYRRVSQEIFKYENVPNDFEAEIRVDGEGLVIDYPQLFKRKWKR